MPFWGIQGLFNIFTLITYLNSSKFFFKNPFKNFGKGYSLAGAMPSRLTVFQVSKERFSLLAGSVKRRASAF